MNKSQFNKYIRESLTKHNKNSNIDEANELIEIFVESVTNALAENDDILLVGFGRFSKTHVESRMGRNPRTGEAIKINSYYQPKFKPGINLKEACNKRKSKKRS